MAELDLSLIKPDFSNGVFAGPRAVRDYINPVNHPPLPLVELPRTVNPLDANGVRIFAKLMTSLPGGHVKFGTVHSMMLRAEQTGTLQGVRQLHESTSGNTGSAEAVLAPHFIDDAEVVVYVHPKTPHAKKRVLQLLGAQVVEDQDTIGRVKAVRYEPGVFNPAQHENLDNPAFFEQVVGPQIWEQTNGAVSVFCAGLGTTGTMVGTGKYLKLQNPDLLTIGIYNSEKEVVPGIRSKSLLDQVTLPWVEVVDRTRIVPAVASYETSLSLIRNAGLQAGPSAGFALRGLLDELIEMNEAEALDTVRHPKSDEVIAVFPVPDGPTPYIDQYFKYLDSSYFKPIISDQ